MTYVGVVESCCPGCSVKMAEHDENQNPNFENPLVVQVVERGWLNMKDTITQTQFLLVNHCSHPSQDEDSCETDGYQDAEEHYQSTKNILKILSSSTLSQSELIETHL